MTAPAKGVTDKVPGFESQRLRSKQNRGSLYPSCARRLITGRQSGTCSPNSAVRVSGLHPGGQGFESSGEYSSPLKDDKAVQESFGNLLNPRRRERD